MPSIERPFKVDALDAKGNLVEPLAEFANLLVAKRCWPILANHYADRRLTTCQGARIIEKHIPNGKADPFALME